MKTTKEIRDEKVKQEWLRFYNSPSGIEHRKWTDLSMCLYNGGESKGKYIGYDGQFRSYTPQTGLRIVSDNALELWNKACERIQ